MPISTPAPIPSWANVTGKPTTISGYGITDSLVNSMAAGNGIAVSGNTGAITASLGTPSFNTVGSYCFCYINTSGSSQPVANSTYSAGSGVNQVRSTNMSFDGAMFSPSAQVTALTGTWRWMSGGASDPTYMSVAGIAMRIA